MFVFFLAGWVKWVGVKDVNGYFDAGVEKFKGGWYENAAELFGLAARSMQNGSREQGEYELWQAEALLAAGSTEDAIQLLHR